MGLCSPAEPRVGMLPLYYNDVVFERAVEREILPEGAPDG